METRIIDGELKLVPYYPADEISLEWYQDLLLCKQVDNIDEPYTRERLHKMYSYLTSHGECYYVAYRDRLVGDCSLLDTGEIAVVICRDYQNRHIGRRCIQELMKRAKEKGMSEIIVNIYAFNQRSRHLVRSLGFEEVDTESFRYLLND